LLAQNLPNEDDLDYTEGQVSANFKVSVWQTAIARIWFDMKSARCVHYHRKVLATLDKLPETAGAFCVGFTEIGSPVAFFSRQCLVAPGPCETRRVGGFFQYQDGREFARSHCVERDRFLMSYSRLSECALSIIGRKEYTLEDIKKQTELSSIQDQLETFFGLPVHYYAFD